VSSTGPRRWEHLAALLVFTGFAAVLLAPALTGGRALFPRDARTAIPWRYHADAALLDALAREPRNDLLTDKNVFDFPKLHLAYRLWREEGKVPLWNPCTFSGNPLLATAMPSPLYPANLLFLVDPYRGFAWAALIHLVLSAFLLYLYVRALALRFAAALVAGTTFAFGGWHMAHLNLPSALYAATWVPLMLLATEKLARRGHPVWFAMLAIATALAFLAGFPPVAVLAVYLTAGYGLFRLRHAWRQDGRRRGVLFPVTVASAVVLGLALVAWQLLPTRDLACQSGRARHDSGQLVEGALRPAGLLGAVLPDFFGNPVDQGTGPDGRGRTDALAPRKLGLDGPPRGSTNNYLENAHYLGLVSLALALLALFGRPRAPALFWSAVAVAALLVTLAVPPLGSLLAHAPGLNVGNVKRFLFVFTLAGAVLAGLGFERLSGSSRSHRRVQAVAFGLGAAGIVAAGVLLAIPPLLETVLAALSRLAHPAALTVSGPETLEWLANTRGCLLRAGAILVPGVALVWLARRRIAPRGVATAVLLLVFLDLAWFGRRFNPMHRPDQLAPTPGIEFLTRPGRPPFRIARFGEPAVAHLVLPPDLGMVYGLHDVQGWDVLFPARYQRFMNLIEPGVARWHHLVGPFLAPGSLRSPLLDLLGARYVLTHRDRGRQPAPGYRRAYPLGPDGSLLRDRVAREGLVIYENTRALPRAFVPDEVVWVPDEAAAFAAIASDAFAPARTAVLEGPPRPLPRSPGGERVRVEIVGYRSRHVEVRVGPGPPAVLVLADAYDPGWVARHGDRELEILKADALFRAVVLPERPAPITIAFHYPGRRFRTGVGVAIAAGFLLLAVLGVTFLRRRSAAIQGRIGHRSRA